MSDVKCYPSLPQNPLVQPDLYNLRPLPLCRLALLALVIRSLQTKPHDFLADD
jgi:hypothetical protein